MIGLPHPKIAPAARAVRQRPHQLGGSGSANEHRLASSPSALLNSALQKWQAKPMLEQPVADGDAAGD